MPVQVIINAADPADALGQMAHFLGLRGLQNQEPQAQLTGAGGTADNGASVETIGAGEPKRRGRKPKEEQQEPAAEHQAADTEEDVGDFLHGDEEQQPAGATHDDVRKALNDVYLKRYGMEATQKDILKLYGLIFKDGSVSKVSDIPEGRQQEVIDGINEMAAKNPFKRARVDSK